MSRDLFCPTGRIYRGNLHGHCTHSDGRNEAAEVVRLYREAGYDFTCLSDHYWTDPRYSAETVCDSSGLDSDDFITIISAELHCHGKLYDQAGLWHILANGLPLDFPIASATETGPELVSRAVAAGAFVSIPHPEWYAMTTEEARSLAEAGAHAVEAYNRPLMPAGAAASPPSTSWRTKGSGPASSPPMIRMMSRPTVSAGG